MTNPSGVNRRQALGVACGAASGVWFPAVARAAPLRKIKVVMAQGPLGLIVQQVAQAQNYFAPFGVDPEVLVVSDGAKCVAALVSGAAEMCAWSGFNQVTPAIERGARIKIVAGSLSIASLAMYSGHPEIRSVKDLAGKTIGIGAPGSVLHQMTVLLLRKHGVNPDHVMFRNVGGNADVFKAVSAKTVDAGLGDVSVFDQQQKFGVHALPDGLLWKEIPEYTNQASYASDAAIQHNRDGLVRLLAAYGKAYRFISRPGSRDAFIKASRSVLGASDQAEALTEWNWVQQTQPYETNLVLSDTRINFVQKLNVEFHVQQQVMPIARIADMSLARDAAKLLQ